MHGSNGQLKNQTLDQGQMAEALAALGTGTRAKKMGVHRWVLQFGNDATCRSDGYPSAYLSVAGGRCAIIRCLAIAGDPRLEPNVVQVFGRDAH